LQDECLEVNKSPLPGPPYGPDPPLQREVGVLTIHGELIRTYVAVDHRMPVNVVTKKYLKELGLENPRYDMSPELLKLAAKVLPWHCGWEQLTLCDPSGRMCLSHDLDFLVVNDDYYGYDLVLGRESMSVNFKAGIYPRFVTPLGSKGILGSCMTPHVIRFVENSRIHLLTTVLFL